ncbi:unnamed protein product [Hymenolepis diminuta]|uniref:UBC core domain-containing protein n=1 Tax=Hymenolepis diminuta TaxID=6216 RepID=A0A3P6ZSW9_HYMDI|nr:unnamed protein product [Hymenolepis diminuta]
MTYKCTYNPREYQCHNTNAQNRLKAPYILYSTHKSGQDLSFSIPRIEASEFKDMVLLRSLKKSEDEIDTRLAKLEPRVKPQKCPWVPPCGPAFGSKIQRITDLESRNTAPPPGTYDPHEPLCQLKKSQLNIEPWKLAPPLPINQMTNLRIRPSVSRPETEYWDTPTFIDLLNNNANKRKGIFQKAERFPKKYGERVCLNASGYSADKEVRLNYGIDQICPQIKTSPFHYNIELTKWKTCELKPSPKVPFGRHGNNSLTQRQYNQKIGNSTPFTGPGRHDPFNYEKKVNKNRYVSMAKRTGRNVNLSVDMALRERIQPKKEANDYTHYDVKSHISRSPYSPVFCFLMESEKSVFLALPPKFIHQYSLMSEYNLIMKYHPPGIYVISSIEDPNVWNGIISVRKGYYCGGAFPFKVEIPDAFPFSRPPKIFLASNFYHPYVHPTTGELDLGSEFEKWVPGSSHIFHILHYFRSVFNDLSIESLNSNDAKKFANPEVAQAFMLEHEKFEIRARTYVEDHSLWSSTDSTSTDAFLNPLRKPILVFGCWHPPFKNCPCCSDAGSRGYSWIDPSKMTLFSPRLLCNEKSD